MPNPSAAEKIASVAASVGAYSVGTLPLMSGPALAVGQLAHVAGYYAGIYSTVSAVNLAGGSWIVTNRHRGRR